MRSALRWCIIGAVGPYTALAADLDSGAFHDSGGGYAAAAWTDSGGPPDSGWAYPEWTGDSGAVLDSGWGYTEWDGDSGALLDSGSADHAWDASGGDSGHGMDSGYAVGPFDTGGVAGHHGWLDVHRWQFIRHQETHFGALGAFARDVGTVHAPDSTELLIVVTDDDGQCQSSAVVELHEDDDSLLATSVLDAFGCAILDVSVGAGDYQLAVRSADGSPIDGYALLFDQWLHMDSPGTPPDDTGLLPPIAVD